VLRELYNIPRGAELSLSSEAKKLWIEYHNDANAALERRSDGPKKAVAAKGITHTARLVLVLHLCRKADGETHSEEVGLRGMEAAQRVGQWLTKETLRVYQELDLGDKSISPVQRFCKKLPNQPRRRMRKRSQKRRISPLARVRSGSVTSWNPPTLKRSSEDYIGKPIGTDAYGLR
jgi:hypothetical protein